jgi:hypothetical protein
MPPPQAADHLEQPGVPAVAPPEEPAGDRNFPSHAPPKLSSGDPLAG